ncbi:TOM1-like protein 5, partial [Cucurbita argyrosperma subsp. sororia]
MLPMPENDEPYDLARSNPRSGFKPSFTLFGPSPILLSPSNADALLGFSISVIFCNLSGLWFPHWKAFLISTCASVGAVCLRSSRVNSATSEKLAETDWMKNIEICELVARDQRQAKDVIKAIKKRIGSKNTNTQLYAVLLLEMLMNNVGEPIHKQVIDSGVLPSLVKIVKKKSNLPVRERIFLLLDATQTALGGASGKFPQYYQAYYDLVSAGVQFPQRPPATPSDNATQQHTNTLQNGVIRLSEQEDAASVEPQTLPESSIIEKASNALEILKEVLDAVDPQRPEGARDEFTLDLVEQCSFQKQKLMHLVLSSRYGSIVSCFFDIALVIYSIHWLHLFYIVP